MTRARRAHRGCDFQQSGANAASPRCEQQASALSSHRCVTASDDTAARMRACTAAALGGRLRLRDAERLRRASRRLARGLRRRTLFAWRIEELVRPSADRRSNPLRCRGGDAPASPGRTHLNRLQLSPKHAIAEVVRTCRTLAYGPPRARSAGDSILTAAARCNSPRITTNSTDTHANPLLPSYPCTCLLVPELSFHRVGHDTRARAAEQLDPSKWVRDPIGRSATSRNSILWALALTTQSSTWSFMTSIPEAQISRRIRPAL